MPSAAGRNITYPKLKVDSLRIPQGGMAFAGIPVMKLPTPSTVKSQRARARKLLQERLKHTLLGLLLTVYVMLLMKNALLR